MGAGKIEQGSERDLRELRSIWNRFGVDGIVSGVASRLLADRRRHIEPRGQASVYALLDTSVRPGNPSIFAAMWIGKPRIISSLQYEDVVFTFMRGSDKLEEVPETHSAYAIGLNRSGFYARYEDGWKTFLGSAEQVSGRGSLQSLIDKHLRSQRR